MKKTGGIIVYAIVIVIVLAGSVGGILYATNGGTTDARLFDIRLEGKNIDGQVISLSNLGEPITFKIAPKFGQKAPPAIQIRALASEESRNVRFNIDGETHSLSACKDLTALFNISDDGDIVTVSSSWDLIGFLADYYAVTREAIELIDYIPGTISFVDLCFISGKITVKCALIEYVEVVGVELEPGSIVIGG